MSIQDQFRFFEQNVQPDFFQVSHGKMIMENLIIEQLSSLDQMIEANRIKRLFNFEFIQYLSKEISLEIQSPEQFLRFLSFIYFSNDRNICCNTLDNLIDSNIVEKYFNNQNSSARSNRSNRSNPSISDFMSDVSLKSNLKEPSKIQKFETSLEDTQRKSNVQPSNKPLYGQFSSEQQNQQLKQQQQQQQKEVFNQPKNQNIQYVQSFNNQNNSEQIKQNLILQNEFKAQKNNNTLMINQQNNQNQLNQQAQIGDLFSNKQKYFLQLVEESKQVIDPISAIKILEDKWKILRFEFDYIVQGANFLCYYQSQKLQIPPIYSDGKSKKKDAQKDAARRFLPHLQFYLRYQQPYYDDQIKEQEYLERKEQMKGQLQEKKESLDDATNTRLQFEEDQKLLFNYQDDRQAVYTLVSMYERNQAQEILTFNDDEKQGDYFKCVVKYEKGNICITKSALGGSKKAAKQVAFMKLNPILQQLYNPEANLDELISIHSRKVDQDRQNCIVNDDNLEDY